MLKTWWRDLGGVLRTSQNIVVDVKRHSRIEEHLCCSVKPARYSFRGRDRLNTEPTDARRDVAEALKLQLRNV